MTAPTASTEHTRQGWERIAERFDEFATPHSLRLGAAVLDHLDLRPGVRFLDVAAGSGALSIPAARRGAEVVAVDIASTMIERLLARARAEGLSTIEGHVMDGTALDLDDGVFDVAASLNGVSLFPDVEAGLRELVRVLEPGGRALIAVFGAPEKAEFVGYLLGAVQAAAPGLTPLPTGEPPAPFQLADRAVLAQRLTEAGLGEVTVENTTWHMPFESGAHFWDVAISTSPAMAVLVADLTPEQVGDITQVLDGMLRERSGGLPGATLTAEMHVGLGTKRRRRVHEPA